MNRVCVVCNGEFYTTKNAQKCCSDECSKERTKLSHKEKHKRKYISKRAKRNCVVCGNEFFGVNKSICCSDKCKEERRKQKVKVKNNKRIYKVDDNGRECNGCGEYKAWDSFTKDKTRKTGYAYKCKECQRKKYDPVKNSIQCSNWKKQNPDRTKEHYYKKGIKRRSYKHKVNFSPHERRELLDRDNWTCQSCGIKVHDEKSNNKTKAHIDHIIPISKGGHSEPSNLQVLCRTCNLSKSDKLIV